MNIFVRKSPCTVFKKFVFTKSDQKTSHSSVLVHEWKTDVGSGQVFWTCTGRNKTLPPSTSFHIQIAGVNIALLGISPHGSKTMARWVEGFHDGLNGNVFDRERDGLRKAVSCP